MERPPPPKRTLSSSLRQYRHAAFFRTNASKAKSSPVLVEDPESTDTPSYGTVHSSSTQSAPQSAPQHEWSHLLHHASVDSSHATRGGLFDHDSDDGSDEEAQDTPQADADGLYPPNCTWTSNTERPARADPFGNSKCNVWTRIHEVRRLIITTIDDPYSLEQLKAPRLNIAVVRPLVDKFYAMQDLSIIYCLLTNRTQFIREQSYATHHQTLNLTRALLCELVAERVLRRYNEHNPGPLGLLKIANILVAGFEPFQGAPDEIIQHNERAKRWAARRRGLRFEDKMTALEIAIVSESKSFLSSTACQRVIDAIYRGKVVYSPNSFIDIIPDHWKRRPISLYDPRRAPLLNQYRLIVPRTRNIIEVVHYVILLVLYLIVMTGRETWKTTKYDALEGLFDVYALGWVLDQCASILEHGWSVYSQNLWSFLDVFFSINFLAYFALRMHGLRVDSVDEDMQWGRTSLDILSCAAPILVPRLAFNIMSDNLLILSLRSMMGDFLTLTGLALWCFGGFLFSLKWLHNDAYEPYTIAKWMIWIWFGLDGTGIEQAPDFHWFLGPMLMILFAFLGNTLFLTILVSMLSNTFSTITANAAQEIQYRRSVLTFMGVKSDAIFAYMPPFNIPALFFLLPLKWIVSPRAFHKLNVVIAKCLNFPILLFIGVYERNSLWVPDRLRHYRPRKVNWSDPNGPRATDSAWWSKAFQMWDFSSLSAHGDIQAVFDHEPPESWFEVETNDSDDRQPVISPIAGLLQVDGTTGGRADALSRPSLLDSQSSSRRKSKKDILREEAVGKEFFDSEDDRKPGNGDYPLSPGTLRKKKRRDSMMDIETPFVASPETNARLTRLEQSMERMEALLMQLLDTSNDDASRGQEELRKDEETERS